MNLCVQIYCICPTYICVTLHHLIGLKVRMNRSTVKFVSFFVHSQDIAVKWVENPECRAFSKVIGKPSLDVSLIL